MTSNSAHGISVAVVGGGIGGIAAAAMLERAGYHDVTVFERNAGLGGVWQTNTYPGAACDVPSHFTSSPSRRILIGRAGTRRRPRSRPTCRTWSATTASRHRSGSTPRCGRRRGTTRATGYGHRQRSTHRGCADHRLRAVDHTNGGTGSVVFTVEAGMSHVLAALAELKRTGQRRIEVRRDAADEFPRELKAALPGTVWMGVRQLVSRRERPQPQPMAVDVGSLCTPDAAPGARRVLGWSHSVADLHI
jgi:hypothetical protein